MGKLFVVGIGPGNTEHMTSYAEDILKNCDVICGYITYINQLPGSITKNVSHIYAYNMGEEIKRVQDAIKFVENGNNVALISGGDASIYGLASLVYEIIENTTVVEVIPGITAVLAAAARLGAPLAEDTIIMSLSDLLIPWETIEKRIKAYAKIDVVCSIYNPKSKKRNWQLKYLVETFYRERGNLFCGAVKNAMRVDEKIKIFTLEEFDYDFIDMSTIVVIGSSNTYLKNNKLITRRGYSL